MASVFRKPPDSDRNIKASLYFGNLDPQVSEPLLYELFVQFAPIRSLNLPKDRILKTHQGFGFVEFRNTQDADYTLSILRGVRLYGKTLKLKKAEPYKGNQAQQQVGAMPYIPISSTNNPNIIDVGAKIFINNLNPLVDEQFLVDTFSRFGSIIKPPVVIRDSETGVSKGYGFITFDDFSSSDTVIEKMNGCILMNSKVSISYAFKEDPISGQKKNVRHGDRIERLLAENAKSNNVFSTNSSSSNKSLNKKSNKVSKPKQKRSNK